MSGGHCRDDHSAERSSAKACPGDRQVRLFAGPSPMDDNVRGTLSRQSFAEREAPRSNVGGTLLKRSFGRVDREALRTWIALTFPPPPCPAQMLCTGKRRVGGWHDGREPP